MNALVIGIAVAVGLALVGYGVWIELRSRASRADLTGSENPPVLAEPWQTRWARWLGPRQPATFTRIAQTAFWLFVLLTLVDHVRSPANSLTGLFIWALTFIPHEAGHMLCSPFGSFLAFAGGTIWQVLIWVLLGLIALFLRRRLDLAIFWGAIAGHSVIRASPYVADARARQLPLVGPGTLPYLLGQSQAPEHDWWNLLSQTGLLEYDQVIAALAVMLGALMVLAMVAAGLVTTWYSPQIEKETQ